MTIRRYARTKVFGLNTRYGTSSAIPAIRKNIANGNIRIIEEFSLKESERLDIIAGQRYGDGRLWWLIAAASNIGWGLQVPPGTLIRIPNLQDLAKYVG
jgi:hypothetical protein